ncbi:MAG TPA: hypothetical protein VFS76_10820 [Pyrinomonadaceae bacterium]|nr:hypothetical protein [Pyrinomonadaceae bacterium]
MPDEPLHEFLKELITAKDEDTQTVLETHVDQLTPDFFLFLRQLIDKFQAESRPEGAAKLAKLAIRAAFVAKSQPLAGAFYELSGQLAIKKNRLEEAKHWRLTPKSWNSGPKRCQRERKDRDISLARRS